MTWVFTLDIIMGRGLPDTPIRIGPITGGGGEGLGGSERANFLAPIRIRHHAYISITLGKWTNPILSLKRGQLLSVLIEVLLQKIFFIVGTTDLGQQVGNLLLELRHPEVRSTIAVQGGVDQRDRVIDGCLEDVTSVLCFKHRHGAAEVEGST